MLGDEAAGETRNPVAEDADDDEAGGADTTFEAEQANGSDDDDDDSGTAAKAVGTFGGTKMKFSKMKKDRRKKKKEARRRRALSRFDDLDIGVFASTEEADRLEEEQELRRRTEWCGLLHPETTASVLYNQTFIFFLCYLLVVMPVRTAFRIELDPGSLAFVMDLFIYVLFVGDIFLNFKKYTLNGTELVTDPKQLRHNYLRGWFIVDVLSVLPADYIILLLRHNDDESNLAKTTRYLRFLRFGRLMRLIKLAKGSSMQDFLNLASEFGSNVGISPEQGQFVGRILFLVFVMLILSHMVGCLWLHIGLTGLQAGEGWMLDGIMDGLHPAGLLLPERGEYIHEYYIDAFYWAMVTMSSVGYGDLLPMTTYERTWAVFVICIGAFLYAYIIGAFSSMMASLSFDRQRYDQKMRTVGHYLKFIGTDAKTTERVNKFYDFRFSRKLMFNEEKMVDELPAKLRSEIVLQRYQRTVDRIPFFRNLTEDVVVSICVQFKEFMVLPGDLIIKRDDPYRELLVLTAGAARSVPAAEEDASLEDAVPEEMIEYPTGTFFGEMEFLGVSDSRPNSIRAKPGHIACELSSLHPKDIRGIVAESEALRWRMQKYKQLKQTLALMAAKGGLTEDDTERVKQETESSFLSRVTEHGRAEAAARASEAAETSSEPVPEDPPPSPGASAVAGSAELGEQMAACCETVQQIHSELCALVGSQAAITQRLDALEAAVKASAEPGGGRRRGTQSPPLGREIAEGAGLENTAEPTPLRLMGAEDSPR